MNKNNKLTATTLKLAVNRFAAMNKTQDAWEEQGKEYRRRGITKALLLAGLKELGFQGVTYDKLSKSKKNVASVKYSRYLRALGYERSSDHGGAKLNPLAFSKARKDEMTEYILNYLIEGGFTGKDVYRALALVAQNAKSFDV